MSTAAHDSTHYEVVVIGTGSGNTVLGPEFAGRRVAIVENRTFGGTCLNRGCIPSKMFVLPATLAHEAAHSEHFELRTRFDGVDWPALRDRVLSRIDGNAARGQAFREGSEHGQGDVDVWLGTARLTGPLSLDVELNEPDQGPDAGPPTVSITTDQLVIATGSRPIVPDIDGLADLPDGVVHTSDSIMRLETFPDRIGIIGGGYVGSEFAHVFADLGAQVVQVDAAEALLTREDADVSALFTSMVRQRWDVRLGTSLTRVEPVDGGDGGDGGTGGTGGAGVRLVLDDGSDAEVDVVLLAIGRTPNADRLGAAEAGLDVDDHGLIVVDEHQRASAPGVWALGDACTHEPLKHVANAEARTVRHNLLHPDDLRATDHRFVPHAVFAEPQIAGVGLTEAQARDQGLDVAVARHDVADIAYGWARHRDPDGFVKLLADRSTGRLVGAHLMCPEASSLIQPLVQAMSFEQPVAGLARGQYWIHPALAEVIENALLSLEDALSG